MFHTSDYSYFLPPERIAQEAAHPHHAARLIHIERETGNILHE
jgi:S-adenosylmethionine:tRNA-ribosyltransferase-isomerase (queuine synthetase)